MGYRKAYLRGTDFRGVQKNGIGYCTPKWGAVDHPDSSPATDFNFDFSSLTKKKEVVINKRSMNKNFEINEDYQEPELKKIEYTDINHYGRMLIFQEICFIRFSSTKKSRDSIAKTRESKIPRVLKDLFRLVVDLQVRSVRENAHSMLVFDQVTSGRQCSECCSQC